MSPAEQELRDARVDWEIAQEDWKAAQVEIHAAKDRWNAAQSKFFDGYEYTPVRLFGAERADATTA